MDCPEFAMEWAGEFLAWASKSRLGSRRGPHSNPNTTSWKLGKYLKYYEISKILPHQVLDFEYRRQTMISFQI